METPKRLHLELKFLTSSKTRNTLIVWFWLYLRFSFVKTVSVTKKEFYSKLPFDFNWHSCHNVEQFWCWLEARLGIFFSMIFELKYLMSPGNILRIISSKFFHLSFVRKKTFFNLSNRQKISNWYFPKNISYADFEFWIKNKRNEIIKLSILKTS